MAEKSALRMRSQTRSPTIDSSEMYTQVNPACAVANARTAPADALSAESLAPIEPAASVTAVTS